MFYFILWLSLCSVWNSTNLKMSPLLALCTGAAWRTATLPWGSAHCRPSVFTYCTFSSSLRHADPLILSQWANPPAAICHKQMFQRTVTSECGCCGGMGARRHFWLETYGARGAWSRWVILAPLRSWGQPIFPWQSGRQKNEWEVPEWGCPGPDIAVMGPDKDWLSRMVSDVSSPTIPHTLIVIMG